MPENLGGWLRYLESLHPKTVELGLERVLAVKERLGLAPAFAIITVAGTNGKGSTCAMLESILRAGGYRTGLYTSPHLLRYNERVRLDGAEADDASLCEAFAAVEAGRGETPLTYFEFGTLAALWLFAREKLDAVVLEVGLGGRLDAVNAWETDCAVVTSVDIDHTDWLGETREAIGFEKAGIFRSVRPAICGDFQPPASLTEHAARLGADLRRIGADFGFDSVEPNGRGEPPPQIMKRRLATTVSLSPNSLPEGAPARSVPAGIGGSPSLQLSPKGRESDRSLSRLRERVRERASAQSGEKRDKVSLRELHSNQWRYWESGGRRLVLPHPALRGAYQLGNASCALAALGALGERLPLSHAAIRRGLLEVVLTGRFQVLPGRPQVILDVAHNPHAAAALAANLRGMPPTGRTLAVFAMLRDKDIAGVVRQLRDAVDVWLCAGIGQPRGAAAEELLAVLDGEGLAGRALCFENAAAAYRHACNMAGVDDRIAAFGSFYTVADVLSERMARPAAQP